MTTIKLPTVEGHEIELDVADHAKLCTWPDLDLSCIHVVGDDALHALKPSTGKLHALSLEEMLKVRIKPCNACQRDLPETVFPTSRTAKTPGRYRSTCNACRNTRRRARRADDEPPVTVPVPGPPGQLLTKYRAAVAPPRDVVWVFVDGVRANRKTTRPRTWTMWIAQADGQAVAWLADVQDASLATRRVLRAELAIDAKETMEEAALGATVH